MRFMIRMFLTTATLAVVGCVPIMRAQPAPDRVAMAGDSILTQALGFGGEDRGADVEGKVNPGWETRNALPRVQQDVADPDTSPDVLVIEFGHNMAMDTYGQVERNELTTMAFAPHASACVVLVLPHPHPDLPAAWRANLNLVIGDMLNLAEVRANTVVVDWSDVVALHPEYLAEDNIHLNAWVDNNPAPASVAFMQMIWSGVEQCD